MSSREAFVACIAALFVWTLLGIAVRRTFMLYMAHRVRKAMREMDGQPPTLFGAPSVMPMSNDDIAAMRARREKAVLENPDHGTYAHLSGSCVICKLDGKLNELDQKLTSVAGALGVRSQPSPSTIAGIAEHGDEVSTKLGT